MTFHVAFAELIEIIRSRNTIVFCGAGISFHSGLPLAFGSKKQKEGGIEHYGLINVILKELSVSDTAIEEVQHSSLPFESFFEIFDSVLDTSELLDVFNADNPSSSHMLLAKLVAKGLVSTIVTTNFDCLIEKALRREGLANGFDFDVFYKDEDFPQIRVSSRRPKVIKLHGCISDKTSIKITLRKVSGKLFSHNLSRLVKNIFSIGADHTVLILGYSCSDLFDISPAIEQCTSEVPKVIIVDHATNSEDVLV